MLASLVLVAARAVLVSDPGAAPARAAEEAKLRALADRCGSQIEWLRDQIGPDDGGSAFKYVEKNKPATPPDLKALLGEALSRARTEQKLVLWHVYRFQGSHMYRAPILDDYMDQVLWSDPTIVELVKKK